jgi:hypothetical protein
MAGMEATTDPLRLTRQLCHILKNNFLALIFHETRTLKPLPRPLLHRRAGLLRLLPALVTVTLFPLTGPRPKFLL